MKKFVIALICLLLAGAAAWYFLRDKSNARDLVPADATTVVVFEPSELMSGLGLTVDDLESLSKAFPNGEEALSLFDFSKPVYSFVTKSQSTGIALEIKDEGELLEELEDEDITVEEQRGFHWFSLDKTLACFDKNKLLVFITTPNAVSDVVRDEMETLMKQGRQDVKLLDKANQQKGLLRMSLAISSLPQELLGALPEGTDLSDAYLNAAFRIGDESLTLAMNVDGPEELSLPIGAIKGNLSAAQPEEPFVWLCSNMKGEQFFPQMQKLPEMKEALEALNTIVDSDMMLKAIDGDIMLTFPKANFEHPDFLLTATLNNTDFLSNKNNWQVARRSDTDFSIGGGDDLYFFGVRDGHLYLASSAELADQAFPKADADALQKEMKGKYLCASLNIGKAIKAYPGIDILLRTLPQLREIAESFDRVTLTSESKQSMELSVQTNKPVKEVVGKLMELTKN